jgi:hypothetical protein
MLGVLGKIVVILGERPLLGVVVSKKGSVMLFDNGQFVVRQFYDGNKLGRVGDIPGMGPSLSYFVKRVEEDGRGRNGEIRYNGAGEILMAPGYNGSAYVGPLYGEMLSSAGVVGVEEKPSWERV